MPLIRLKERCFIFGQVHERGAVVRMPEGMAGPHRAERVSHDRIDYSIDPAIDANRIIGELVDVPLYDVIEEPLP